MSGQSSVPTSRRATHGGAADYCRLNPFIDIRIISQLIICFQWGRGLRRALGGSPPRSWGIGSNEARRQPGRQRGRDGSRSSDLHLIDQPRIVRSHSRPLPLRPLCTTPPDSISCCGSGRSVVSSSGKTPKRITSDKISARSSWEVTSSGMFGMLVRSAATFMADSLGWRYGAIFWQCQQRRGINRLWI